MHLNQWTTPVMKNSGIVSWVLIFLFFLNRVKRHLEDNLEIFLYLKFGFYSFVLSNLSLYSVFSHFCFCKRTCDQKKSNECYCQFCSRIYPQMFDNHNNFQDIIADERDLTREFNYFFQKTSLFSLDLCQDHALFVDSKKLRSSTVHILVLLRHQLNFLNLFWSVLIRLYLIIFFLCWMNVIWKKHNWYFLGNKFGLLLLTLCMSFVYMLNLSILIIFLLVWNFQKVIQQLAIEL